MNMKRAIEAILGITLATAINCEKQAETTKHDIKKEIDEKETKYYKKEEQKNLTLKIQKKYGNYTQDQIIEMIYGYINTKHENRNIEIASKEFQEKLFTKDYQLIGSKNNYKIFHVKEKKYTNPEISLKPEKDILEDEINLTQYKIKDYKLRAIENSDIIIPNDKITENIGNIEYDITIKELADYFYGKATYGKNRGEKISYIHNNTIMRFRDHTQPITKGKESCLERLVKKITTNNSKEEKTQQIMDFICENIAYDYLERYENKNDFLKRPIETLMTKKGDCSAKTILFASMLEQIGQEYILTYLSFDKLCHIAIAVKGNFKETNENLEEASKEYEKASGIEAPKPYYLEYKGSKYYLCETTSKQWKIGSKFNFTNFAKYNVTFIQEPGKEIKKFNGYQSW